MLGGFNFLENIREENDEELEDDELHDCHDGLESQHKRHDHKQVSFKDRNRRDSRIAYADASSETCTTSFESTEHTRSLSDTSSNHEDTDVRESGNGNQANSSQHADASTQSFEAQTKECLDQVQDGGNGGSSSKTRRFLLQAFGSAYQEMPEETCRSKSKWFGIFKFRKLPSSSKRPCSCNTTVPVAEMDRRLGKSNSPGSLKSSSMSRRKLRKAPSGSFASAIGREENYRGTKEELR